MLPAPNNSRASLARRLRSQRGETLAETLVAMLIAGLSLLALSQTISVAAGIIQRNGELAETYYTNVSKLAEPTTTEGSPKVTVTGLVSTDITTIKYDLETLPGNVNVVSYKLK